MKNDSTSMRLEIAATVTLLLLLLLPRCRLRYKQRKNPAKFPTQQRQQQRTAATAAAVMAAVIQKLETSLMLDKAQPGMVRGKSLEKLIEAEIATTRRVGEGGRADRKRRGRGRGTT